MPEVTDQDVYDALDAEDRGLPIEVVREKRLAQEMASKVRFDEFSARFDAKKKELEATNA